MESNTAVPKLYIGIDVHKRSWKVNIYTEICGGKTMTIPPRADQLHTYISKHYSDAQQVQVAYEAGCCGFSHHRKFISYGWKSMVVNPADIHRKGKEQYTKTDKIDAQLIARELRDGRLTSISVPDEKREGLRSLFRRRNDLVKQYRKVKGRIKSQLLYLGVDLPQEYDNSYWSHAFRGWLDEMNFKEPTMALTLKSRMRSFRFIDEELREVSNQLRKYCRSHYKQQYTLLRSVPGIGPIVSVAILSEVGDLNRFNNEKQLCSYVGLMPGIYESGGKLRTKGMTPRCNRLMRSYFIEASWQAIRSDPAIQRYYRKKISEGKQSKQVVVKIARKLLCRARAVIRTNQSYEIGIIE